MVSKLKERILVIGSTKGVCGALCTCLKEEYKIDSSESFESALKTISHKEYNVVITEIGGVEAKGVEILHKLKESKTDVPIVVITTHNSVHLAVAAMKAGAYDYITLPFNPDELRLVILRAAEWKRLVEEVKEKKIFQEMALIDSLTEVYNRRYFDELLRRESERASRYEQKFSLLMIDIDDFKSYNDRYGHLGGDKVLKEVASVIISKSRSTDFVARYGGEEFAVITPHTDKSSAVVLGVRLVHGVANLGITLENKVKTRITISVGIAAFGDDAASKEELIKRSDEALYQAKKLGKNRVCMFGVQEQNVA